MMSHMQPHSLILFESRDAASPSSTKESSPGAAGFTHRDMKAHESASMAKTMIHCYQILLFLSPEGPHQDVWWVYEFTVESGWRTPENITE